MTTADLIAVMNGGKIEQAGSPEEIYDRPRSEFVARFIGSSNVIKGKVLDEQPSLVRRLRRCAAPAASSCQAATARSRCASTWCRLWARKPENTDNVMPGTVMRQVFLGVEPRLHGRDRGRHADCASSPRPARTFRRAPSVWLYLPPERCRVLSG